MSEPVLFLAKREENHFGLVAALEERHSGALGREGARARMQLVPSLEPLVSDDVRGRRIDLRSLLQPNDSGWNTREVLSEELCDLAGHLIELPEVGTPGSDGDQRHPLRLRLLEDSIPALQPLWPAPGGGWFEIDVAPLRLSAAGFAHAAHLAGPEDGRPADLRVGLGQEPRIASLIALLREAGAGGVEPNERSFLADWVARERDSGGAGLSGKRASIALTCLREALCATLRAGESMAKDARGIFATVHLDRGETSSEWCFTLSLEGEPDVVLRHPVARANPVVLTQLLDLRPSLLAPHWLLLFEGGGGRPAQLTSVVDARRFLLEHPETWRFGGDVPGALEVGTSLLDEQTPASETQAPEEAQ